MRAQRERNVKTRVVLSLGEWATAAKMILFSLRIVLEV